MGFNGNEKSEIHRLTSFEVFIVISFLVMIFAVIFNLNVEIDENSTVRLQNMNVDELWATVNAKDFDDSIKLKAFDKLTTLVQSDKLCAKTYEMLYNPTYNVTLTNRFRTFVDKHPSEALSERVANDFINQKMTEKLWNSIKQSWSKTLLPQAFTNSQLLFKGMKENEDSRLTFVVDVLSLDNNSYLIEVVEKYLNQSKEFRNSALNMKIVDSLYSLKLNQADDVLRIMLKILSNNGTYYDFTTFSIKIEATIKKFAHTKDIRERFQTSLAAVNASRWNSLRKKMIKWLKIVDN